MSSRLAGWFLGSLVGAHVVALPDDDARVFSLSRTHGPSPLDLLGVGVLIAAWLPVAALLWSSSAAVRGRWAVGTAGLGLTGLLLLGITIARDSGREWLLAGALLIGAQLVALGAVRRNISGDVDDAQRVREALPSLQPGRGRSVPACHGLHRGGQAPPGRLAGDWLHTVLHLLSAAAAIHVGWLSRSTTPARVFTLAVALVYPLLGLVGWFTQGLLLGTVVALPLGAADNVFHLLLGVPALALALGSARPAQRLRRRVPARARTVPGRGGCCSAGSRCGTARPAGER